MTKEAKLSAAMRIVPEWKEYDDEIKALQARVRRGLYQSSDHEQVPYKAHLNFFFIIINSSNGSRGCNSYISIISTYRQHQKGQDQNIAKCQISSHLFRHYKLSI